MPRACRRSASAARKAGTRYSCPGGCWELTENSCRPWRAHYTQTAVIIGCLAEGVAEDVGSQEVWRCWEGSQDGPPERGCSPGPTRGRKSGGGSGKQSFSYNEEQTSLLGREVWEIQPAAPSQSAGKMRGAAGTVEGVLVWPGLG